MMTDSMGFLVFLGLAVACRAWSASQRRPHHLERMPELHLSKVAFGCASLETLTRRLEARVTDGIVPVVTRFLPKRADELVGGSLFWIVKQRLAARQTILGFGEREQTGARSSGSIPSWCRCARSPSARIRAGAIWRRPMRPPISAKTMTG